MEDYSEKLAKYFDLAYDPEHETSTYILNCLECGATVGFNNTELHVTWHERIEAELGRLLRILLKRAGI